MTAPETPVRLAVFTAKYPARVSTFFERDMLSLMAAGVDLRRASSTSSRVTTGRSRTPSPRRS